MSINIKEFHNFMSTYIKSHVSDGITFSNLNNLFNDHLSRNNSSDLAYSGLFVPLVELYVLCSGQPYAIENRNRIRKLKGWTFTDDRMLKLASILENGLVNEATQKETNQLYTSIADKLKREQVTQGTQSDFDPK